MASFHDQWMDAHRELSETRRLFTVTEALALDVDLSRARELIDEDNPFKVRQEGGQIIREVRLACRTARESAAA